MDLTVYHVIVVGLVSISFFIVGLILVDLVTYITRRRKRMKRKEDEDK